MCGTLTYILPFKSTKHKQIYHTWSYGSEDLCDYFTSDVFDP